MCAMMPAGGDEGGRCVRSRPRGCQVGSTRGASELGVECSQLVHGVRSHVAAAGSPHHAAEFLRTSCRPRCGDGCGALPVMFGEASDGAGGPRQCIRCGARRGRWRSRWWGQARRECALPPPMRRETAATGTVTFADMPGRLRVAYDEERPHVRSRAHSAGWRHQRVDESRGSGQHSSPALH